MIKQLDLWNHNINEETRNTITQDVNAFIRDYIRGIQKTLTNSTFNAERIRNLAQTLADTPSLRSIKNKAALRNYIELYILKLVQLYL
ncbi:hypothetical protein [Treponema phagedenis]|uniref:hypothetical protein n=1 Tax=Treponema phagedenis TaxID=162 RepID=UPI0015A10B37|nr:hypothetical protein [Treponema phagedenis]NVP24408.1 hypothetical protein [Treponema phagedenis]QLC59905.1 hypothetical protein HW453_14710 [Treponema phagedenis]